MPVSVKEYLDSMKKVSSSTKTVTKEVDQDNLKMQQLLSNLIEAISYANSIDFRKKSLNKEAPSGGKTGKQIVDQIKAQEKLIDQLAKGQKLDELQNRELTDAINKFYEIASVQEINYKKFATNLEKFALKQPLPEAVQTRLINDSRDAHMIGQEQKTKEGPIIPILKKMRNMLEDSLENTKQFRKKLFVSFDSFREGLMSGLDNLKDGLSETGTIFDKILDAAKIAGMAWMVFQGQFKEGNFKFGQLFKQASKFMLKDFQQGFTKIMGDLFGKGLGGLSKMLGKFGASGAAKTVAKFGKLGAKFLKKIPLIGTIMSLWMGVERWKQKDYAGALIEFGSGIAAMFPGVGTAISVLLDLINLGRDTGAFAKAGDAIKDFSNTALGENVLMNIPLVGPIFGTIKAIDLFKKGDKKAAFRMAGKALASIIPGGAGIFSIFEALLGKKIEPEAASSSSGGSFKWPWQKKDKDFGDGPFGDAPIKWQNESGGYSDKGLTSNAKTAAKNLNKLVGGGMVITSAMRDPQKMMPLWNEARPIPGSRNRINRYGNEMANPMRSNHRFGTAIDVPKSLYNRIGASKFTALAKQAGFNLVYPEHSAVHLEVPKDGKIAKVDSKAAMTQASGLEQFDEADSSQMANASMDEPTSFQAVMDMFNKFNQDIVAGVPANSAAPAQTASISPATSGPEAPSIESISAGTPAAVTANATTKVASRPAANATAPAQQVVQTKMAPGQPDTMTTEINDTDLALLNSIIFS